MRKCLKKWVPIHNFSKTVEGKVELNFREIEQVSIIDSTDFVFNFESIELTGIELPGFDVSNMMSVEDIGRTLNLQKNSAYRN